MYFLSSARTSCTETELEREADVPCVILPDFLGSGRVGPFFFVRDAGFSLGCRGIFAGEMERERFTGEAVCEVCLIVGTRVG